MNRRGFLMKTVFASTALGGLALSAKQARAWTTQTCKDTATNPACREIARHANLLSELHADLTKQGYTPAQQQVILAQAVCPVCGQLLVG